MTEPLRMLALEITGACQLNCTTCYAGSSPQGTHGTMTVQEWEGVITEAAAPGTLVQFIGGEPTLHPELPRLIRHALDLGQPVEVFTNLQHLPPPVWQALAQPGVSVASSFYGTDPATFTAHTRARPAGARRWWANVERVTNAGIPLRVGLTVGGPDSEPAARRLEGMGVRVRRDTIRHIGRAAPADPRPHDTTQLCGRCADNVLAVLPDGTATPCTMAREWAVGNVKEDSVEQVMTSTRRAAVRAHLEGSFTQRTACYPDCIPGCGPMSDCLPRNPQAAPRPATQEA